MRVLISPEDQHLLARHSWHQAATGYIRRWDRSVQPPRLIGLHREIMGDPIGKVVDHINGDPSDNRRENLRVCSQAENSRNCTVRKHNRIGIKGVYADPRRGTYRAQIRIDGKKVALGSYRTVDEAKAAYAEASNKLHGEFARMQ